MGITEVLIILTGLFVLVLSSCPIDWVEQNGDCYQFSSKSLTWFDAATACRQLGSGSHLLTDNSQDKHNFLKTYLQVFWSMGKRSFWTGLSDFSTEGTWRWVSDQSVLSGFSAWGPGEPDGNVTANCALLRWFNDTIGWADARCSSRHDHHNYICERPLSSFGLP